MKWELIILLIFFTGFTGLERLSAQDLPACISALIKQGDQSNKSFAGQRRVSQGRTVYAVNIKRPPKCMDCAGGTVYYDSNCTAVASFTIGYAPAAFIKPGYLPGDFIEARSPVFASKLANRKAIPVCISKAIANADSLIKAGVASVQSVSIAGRNLYCFQPVPVAKNCHDCAVYVPFYDSTCNLVARFSVGGYAGIVAPAGFTKQDFLDKKILQVLWSAPSTNTGSAITTTTPPGLFSTPTSFIITESYDTVMNVFKKDDRLTISTAKGLYHYRDGKLINQYKIIPQKVTQQYTSPCQVPPCPTRREDKLVYYLEPFKRYIDISVLPDRAWFKVSKKTINTAGEIASFGEGDWETWYKLRSVVL